MNRHHPPFSCGSSSSTFFEWIVIIHLFRVDRHHSPVSCGSSSSTFLCARVAWRPSARGRTHARVRRAGGRAPHQTGRRPGNSDSREMGGRWEGDSTPRHGAAARSCSLLQCPTWPAVRDQAAPENIPRIRLAHAHSEYHIAELEVKTLANRLRISTSGVSLESH